MNKIIKQTIKDIKDLKIQGATSVARESIKALGVYSSTNKWTLKELKIASAKLAFARPTEPLTRNCVNWLLGKAKSKEGRSLLNDSEEIITSLKRSKEEIIKNGLNLVKENSIILTHCHSSTVTGILVQAHKFGKKFKVYLTETRPRYQGHITAKELVDNGIDAAMMTDSQAVFVVSNEDKIKIDFVVVGADAINKDGSALNKVGSYGLSLSAKVAKVPFYVTATILKFSPTEIPIEIRSSKEVWEGKPEKLNILNLAFDKIPALNITSYITEFGLIKPDIVIKTAEKEYPWIFDKNYIF